jgi:hypothetical protein
LRREPAMGWVVGGRAPMAQARLAGWAASRASG